MEEPATQDSCSSNVLLFPQIVKKVFQFLSAKDIGKAASVCKLWHDEGEIVLRQRRQYSWQLFGNSDGQDSGDPDHSRLLTEIQNYFKELSFRPTSVVVFITAVLWDLFRNKRGKTGKRARKEKDVNLAANLPPQCSIVMAVTGGIVGTSSDLKRTEEREEVEGAAVLCVGDHPGFRVVPCKSLYTPDNYFDHAFRTFNSAVERPELLDVKAILLLPHVYHPSMNDLSEVDLCEKYQRPLLVGGIPNQCFIEGPMLDDSAKFLHPDCKVATFMDRGDQDSGSCSAPQYGLCGLTQKKCKNNYLGQVLIHGKQVQVACVRFSQDVDTEQLAEETILKLKEKSRAFCFDNSLAFMFACVARGEEHYCKVNVESSAFRKHFPNTPLLGLFGGGEIGCDYPIQAGEPHVLNHGYTTFIALVCFP